MTAKKKKDRRQKNEGNKWISKRKWDEHWEENMNIEDVIEKANYRCKIEEWSKKRNSEKR